MSGAQNRYIGRRKEKKNRLICDFLLIVSIGLALIVAAITKMPFFRRNSRLICRPSGNSRTERKTR